MEKERTMNVKKASGIVFLLLLFVSGVAGGYYYFSRILPHERAFPGDTAAAPKSENLLLLRIYYPVGGQLQMEERRPPRRTGSTSVAEATVDEYLRGSAVATIPFMPKNARLLGVLRGADGILYVDLSDEFRRNFQGDALAEFLLLKGLYESLISNEQDIQDVKILIEGKEIETLGGHLPLTYPLKELVSYEY
jgi:hypothetical protein